MKRILIPINIILYLFIFTHICMAQTLPDIIQSGPFKSGHIQGIAIDAEHKYIYCSYTTMLVKSDMQGNIIGSVTGFLGHLGCLDFCKEDGRIYGSLEYKNDAIGKGILKMQNSLIEAENAFYIAIFNPERITRMNMDAEKDGIMTTVYLPTVLDDYLAEIETENGKKSHRFGCSGIDGLSFGPDFGSSKDKQYLTVAYGIYGDTARSDNDYQVLLQYDTKKWYKYEQILSQQNKHKSGPVKPKNRYFVMTGNTVFGVQNLEYDEENKVWFMSVYKGNKKRFPNYTLFAIDGTRRSVKKKPTGIPYISKGNILSLKSIGKQDKATGIRGWDFPFGTTGICSLGKNLFYISHNYKNESGEGSIIKLYRFNKDENIPFEAVE